jgi:hypothetical protein
MGSRNAVVLNGALGLSSLHGVELQRSPATVRLLAVETLLKNVRTSVIRLLESKKTATPRVSADVRFKEL